MKEVSLGQEVAGSLWLLLIVSEEALLSYPWRSTERGKFRIGSKIRGTKVFPKGQFGSGESSCSKIARVFIRSRKGSETCMVSLGKNVPKLEITSEKSL